MRLLKAIGMVLASMVVASPASAAIDEPYLWETEVIEQCAPSLDSAFGISRDTAVYRCQCFVFGLGSVLDKIDSETRSGCRVSEFSERFRNDDFVPTLTDLIASFRDGSIGYYLPGYHLHGDAIETKADICFNRDGLEVFSDLNVRQNTPGKKFNWEICRRDDGECLRTRACVATFDEIIARFIDGGFAEQAYLTGLPYRVCGDANVADTQSRQENLPTPAELFTAECERNVTHSALYDCACAANEVARQFGTDPNPDFSAGTSIFDLTRGRLGCPNEPGIRQDATDWCQNHLRMFGRDLTSTRKDEVCSCVAERVATGFQEDPNTRRYGDLQSDSMVTCQR